MVNLLTTEEYIKQLKKDVLTLALGRCYDKGDGDIKKGYLMFKEEYPEHQYSDHKVIIDVVGEYLGVVSDV